MNDTEAKRVLKKISGQLEPGDEVVCVCASCRKNEPFRSGRVLWRLKERHQQRWIADQYRDGKLYHTDAELTENCELRLV